METVQETAKTEPTGYTQDYALAYLGRLCRCSSLYPRNKVGTYDKKVLLIPYGRLGIKRWGMVDYLCLYCGWSWKYESKELKAQQADLAHRQRELEAKALEETRKGSK